MAQYLVAAGDTLVTSRQRYTLGTRLGGGMAGAVYDAVDRDGLAHAVKILTTRPTDFQIRGFRNEVAFGYRKLHPGIVVVEDDGVVDDTPFLVMPRYRTTLRPLIDAGLPPDRAVLYFEQARAAIVAAHQAGVAHQDVKPENLLVGHVGGRDHDLVVADWGTADFDTTAHHASLPPEVRARAAGRGTPGTGADLYALGLLLVALLTGQPHGAGTLRPLGAIAPEFAYLDDLAATLLTDRNRIAYALVG